MPPFHCLARPIRVDIHKVPAIALQVHLSFLFVCFCLGGRGRAQELVPAGFYVLTSACLAIIVLNSVSDVFS